MTHTFVISGRFDFNKVKELKYKFEEFVSSVKPLEEIIVDLSNVNYVDSSALGLILEFRALAAKKQATIILHNPTDLVKQVLKIANFEKLFSIER